MVLKRLKKSNLLSSVATLSLGTAIAQAVPIAVTPILTRIYSPEDFGLVAIYMSCVAVLSIITTGRYEIAIPLPVLDIEAANLVILALKICMVISLFLILPVILFSDDVAIIFNNKALEPWLYFLPIAVFATGTFNILQFWCNRASQYRRMAINRIQKSVFVAGLNIVLGLCSLKGGMIFGNTFGNALSAGWITHTIRQETKELLHKVNWHDQWKMAKRYISHPMHIAPSQIIGTLAMQIPIFLVSSVYSIDTAGFFALAYRLVSLPTVLVAGAIGDVYRQKIAKIYNEKGDFQDVLLKTVFATTLFAILPFSGLYFLAPSLFAFAFGESWKIAGNFAQILLVASFFQFIFVPIDKGAVVVGATKYIFGWHLIRLCAFVSLLIFAHKMKIPVEQFLWIFVAINTFLYIIDGFIEYRLAKGRKKSA